MYWRSVTAATVRNLAILPVLKLNMKMILLFTCAITLLATTGCYYPGHGHGGGGRDWHGRAEIIVAPRAVVARAPDVIVAPLVVAVNAPEVVVR
jgi:hypothetical protein